MNIMVLNVAAESVGALSVLSDFYDEISQRSGQDIDWVFVLGNVRFRETDNVSIVNHPWVKKSWFHRLFFDYVVAPKLVRKYGITRIISLQNTAVPRTKVEQFVYLHNSIPFSDQRFTFGGDNLLWMYQNVIGKLIIFSVKRAKRVIVQTEWMKRACAERAGVPLEKITVVQPNISVKVRKTFTPEKNHMKTFFYPAMAYDYKNHRLIVEACERLVDQGVSDFQVVFTLNGDESLLREQFERIRSKKLPVQLVGHLSREEVFEYYTNTVLLFPSYLETFGLPILEARLHEGIILASDTPFAHEILEGYQNAYFFDPFQVNELCHLMARCINRKIIYYGNHKTPDTNAAIGIYDVVTS